EAVVRSDDPVGPRVRQFPVPNKIADPAGVEKGLVLVRYGVDHSGKSERIVGPSPALARQGDAGRRRSIDVGELVGFDAAAGEARACKEAHVFDQLLLHVEADAGPATISPHRFDVRRIAGHLGKSHRVAETPHAAAREEPGDRYLARLTPKVVPPFDFRQQLKLTEGRIEVGAVWHD